MKALLRGLVKGAGLGLVWGVVARVFMRLLTTAPSFSWSGTLFILGLAALAGACFGLVHAARVAERSRWWRLAALPALALFAGPGMVLAPAAIGMAMVLRGRWVVRVVGAVVVTGPSPLIAVLSAETAGAPRPSSWVSPSWCSRLHRWDGAWERSCGGGELGRYRIRRRSRCVLRPWPSCDPGARGVRDGEEAEHSRHPAP